MHVFDYSRISEHLLSKETVQLIAAVHEYKGRQACFFECCRDELKTLQEVARIQSTGASNRIEGIRTCDSRLAELMNEKAEPRTRSEREIAGYRKVLAVIHENYEYMRLSPGLILQLHRDLYAYSASGGGGVFKEADNVISETGTDGKTFVRFRPVPAFGTEAAVTDLCRAFEDTWEREPGLRLILIAMFVLDFLCIHPFNDGNGRMSRLMTLLLLYRAGYTVGKYISIEMQIEQSKETYCEALHIGSDGWHTNTNDYAPFVRYMLGVLLSASREFESRVDYLKQRGQTKTERIRAVFERHADRLTKRQLMAECPDISSVTVERTLTELVRSGVIRRIGAGRATSYIRA